MTDTLTPFDGKDVRAATVKITHAGDGLSKAMKVNPSELHHQETVFVVLECVVSKVGFDPISEDSTDLMRVHTLKAGLATIVDGELVRDVLAAQQKILDDAKGIQQLPYKDPDNDGDEANDQAGGEDADGFSGDPETPPHVADIASRSRARQAAKAAAGSS